MKQLFTLIIVLFITFSASAQNWSLAEAYNDWEDDAAWSMGASPLNDILGGDATVVDGKVRRNGALTVSGFWNDNGTLIINDNDTLVVDGDMVSGVFGDVIVGNDALLIVLGDMSALPFTNFVNNGVVYVTENIDVLTIFGADNNGDLYGGSYSGFATVANPQSTADAPSELQNFVSSGAPLPIELKYFNAVTKGKSALLEWASLSEVNFSHYEIERSSDGKSFESIALVQPQGGENTEASYEYMDVMPFSGNNYYRLKAVDLDDTFEYFEVKHVFVQNDNQGFRLQQNPIAAAEELKLISNIPDNTTIDRISLFNAKGELVEDFTSYNLNKTTFSTSILPRGIYHLIIHDGTVEQQIRVLVR